MGLRQFLLYQFIFIIFCICTIYSQTDMNLVPYDVNPEPHDVDKPFYMDFRDRHGGSVIKNQFDTMILVFRKRITGELVKLIYHYGFSKKTNNLYKGGTINIIEWARTESKRRIYLKIKFGRDAHGGNLKIYRVLVPNPDQFDYSVENGRVPENLVYEIRSLSLLIPPKLTYGLVSDDGRVGELATGTNRFGRLWCEASDGQPPRPVIIRGIERLLDVEESSQNIENGLRTEIRFRPRLVDHLRTLRCASGSSAINITLLVMHSPSQLLFEPDPEPPLRKLRNGTTVICTAANGQPTPKVYWKFISGPINASSYYQISSVQPNHLVIFKSAPLSSEWQFNCTAENYLPTSGLYKFNRTFQFTIGNPEEGSLVINMTMKIVIGIAVIGGVLLFFIIILLIICMVRRSCDSEYAEEGYGAGQVGGGGVRNNGVNPKSMVDKKNLDTEQVTLLAPGRLAPQATNIHPDQLNDTSGLPPPPPELVANDDGTLKHSMGYTTQHTQEVMYAELGELPMKGGSCSSGGGGTLPHQGVNEHMMIDDQIRCVSGTENEYMNTGSLNGVPHAQVTPMIQLDHQVSHSSTNSISGGSGAAATGEVIYSQIVGTLPTQQQACNGTTINI